MASTNGTDTATRIERRELDGGFVLVGDEGRAVVRELVPGVVRAAYSGTALGDFAPPVLALLERRIDEGMRVTICVDAQRMEAYESRHRERWSRWLGEHRDDIESIPMLVSSGVVRLAIGVVNPLVGNVMQPLARRDDFEAVVGDLLAARDGLRHVM